MDIQDFFKNSDHLVKIQFPSPETLYAWQHMTQFYPTARVARAGNSRIKERRISHDKQVYKNRHASMDA